MVGTITNAGLEYEAKLLVGISVKPFKYIACGSGTTAEANDQTALVTEITDKGVARAEGTPSYDGSYTVSVTKTFTATDTVAINEVALLDTATTGGKMYARGKFADTKNLAEDDTIQVTFTIVKGRAA